MAKPLHPHNRLDKTDVPGEEGVGVGVAEVEAEKIGDNREGEVADPPKEVDNR